jgi:hypothetical protein
MISANSRINLIPRCLRRGRSLHNPMFSLNIFFACFFMILRLFETTNRKKVNFFVEDNTFAINISTKRIG